MQNIIEGFHNRSTVLIIVKLFPWESQECLLFKLAELQIDHYNPIARSSLLQWIFKAMTLIQFLVTCFMAGTTSFYQILTNVCAVQADTLPLLTRLLCS